MSHIIRKNTGEGEPFAIEKLAKSLVLAGAQPDLAMKIAASVAQENRKTSKEIHRATLHQTLKHDRRLAIHYNLKQALMDLGPSGYPFEKYMAALMAEGGYGAKTNRILPGKCVTHEVDIYLEKPKQKIIGIAECKFRNQPGSKIDVKIPLYFDSRFRDVTWKLEQQLGQGTHTYEGWIITNTKFSGDAITYAKCAGIHLLGWTYPQENSIAKRIERHGLMPLTALTSLTSRQKRVLLEKGLVLCSDIASHKNLLRRIGVSRDTLKLVEEDLGSVCGET